MPIELEDTALPTSAPSAAASATATAMPRKASDPTDAGAPAGGRLEPGKRLAHFKIDRLLGEGGMGQVYLATDLALDRPVALKVLPPAVAQDSSRRQRLIREARAQARINHPNVCHIYFIGEEHGHLFFAMEYVEGESVAEVVARGPLPVDRALSIVKMAAEGLREADRRGFTHRDVKPSNLMIDRDGRVKVVDFGLVTDAPGGDDDPDNVALTGVAGTPLYMAPEQARGETVDHRSDVYALGATLYHLVAGAPPFAATSAGELLAMHSTAHRPALPKRGRGRELRRLPVLYDLYSRMMAADPAERFATYDELIAELDRVSPVVTRPAGAVARGAAVALDMLVLVPFAIVSEMLPYEMTIRDEIVLLPGLWLYGAFALWRFGRTIGKALLDLEVVSIRSQRPKLTFATAALRTGVYVFPLWIAVLVREIGTQLRTTAPDAARVVATLGSVLIVLTCVWAIASLVWTSWRRPDKRTPWDRAAGTMVRYLRQTG